MPARNVLESQQSVQATVAGRPAAGCWKLAPGRAQSLHPRERCVLEIAQGRVWLTLSGASPADHVLQAGDRIAIAAGQHVVMEAWNPTGVGAGVAAEGVAFDWDGALALAPVRGPRALRPGAEWECGVVQPLRDLVQALAQGGRAVGLAGAQALGAGGRLALGVVRFAPFLMVKPVGSQRLQYRFARTAVEADSIATPWWRRAAFGSPSVAIANDACCA